MCELFALSSLFPTRVDFSLERLARRGGAEGPHRDGWGVAFYEGADALLLREPEAASESALVRHIERHGPPSTCVISHIRLATLGERALRNTQPFARELGGRMHLFAHNGDLPDLRGREVPGAGRFRPIGESDSEIAFCHLLADLEPLWSAKPGGVPPLPSRMAVLRAFADRMRALGIANFLYCDSEILVAHADRRRLPDSAAEQPGLYVLQRSCDESVPDLAAAGVKLRSVRQALTLVASAPLTDEDWRPLARGEMLQIRSGMISGRCTQAEEQGRGE